VHLVRGDSLDIAAFKAPPEERPDMPEGRISALRGSVHLVEQRGDVAARYLSELHSRKLREIAGE
jgi:hypothetical protein